MRESEKNDPMAARGKRILSGLVVISTSRHVDPPGSYESPPVPNNAANRVHDK